MILRRLCRLATSSAATPLTDAELALASSMAKLRGEASTEAAAYVEAVTESVAVVRNAPWARMSSQIRFRSADGAKEGRGLVVRIGKQRVHALVLKEPVSVGDAVPVEPRGDARRALTVPVGDAVLGRVLDALGRAIDGKGKVTAAAVEQRELGFSPPSVSPPPVRQRALFHTKFTSGVPMLDALAPIARGQRLVVMGAGEAPSDFALELALAQSRGDQDADGPPLRIVYAPVRGGFRAHHALVQRLTRAGALEHTTVVVSSSPGEGGLTTNAAHQALAPFAALRIAERIRDEGGHALCVIDGMDAHAEAVAALAALTHVPANPRACQAAMLLSAAQLSDEGGGGSLTLICTAAEAETTISRSMGESLAASCDAVIRLDGAAPSSTSTGGANDGPLAPALSAWTLHPSNGTAFFQGAAFQELATLLQREVSALFIYRYISHESCSQFDSLPLTSLTLLQREIADDRDDHRAAVVGGDLGVELEPNSPQDLSLRFRDAVNDLLPRRSAGAGRAGSDSAQERETHDSPRRLVRLYLAASRDFVASLSLHDVPPLEFEAALWERVRGDAALLAWVVQLAAMPPRHSRSIVSAHIDRDEDGTKRLLGEAMWYPLRTAVTALAEEHLAQYGSIDPVSLRWVLRQIKI
jgi:F-type H+-transporting ATPase subunit alpha